MHNWGYFTLLTGVTTTSITGDGAHLVWAWRLCSTAVLRLQLESWGFFVRNDFADGFFGSDMFDLDLLKVDFLRILPW